MDHKELLDVIYFEAKVAIELYHSGVKSVHYAESAIEKVEDLLNILDPYLHSTILIRLERLESILSLVQLEKRLPNMQIAVPTKDMSLPLAHIKMIK